MKQKIIFCDIEGTILHYKKHFQSYAEIIDEDQSLGKAVYRDIKNGEERLCKMFNSLSSGPAYISELTLTLVSDLREKGYIFALISGLGRESLQKRLEILPKSDYIICENGAVVYQNNIIDTDWSARAESGKGQAAAYLLEKLQIDPRNCLALIDNDNDLPLTQITRRILIPQISGPELNAAIAQNPHWYLAKRKGILATEECLERILGFK